MGIREQIIEASQELNFDEPQTLLNESETKEEIVEKEVVKKEVVEEGLFQGARDAFNTGMRRIGSTGDIGKDIEVNVKKSVDYIKQHKPEFLIGGAATTAVGAGIGAVLLAKKLRAKKKKAAEKAAAAKA